MAWRAAVASAWYALSQAPADRGGKRQVVATVLGRQCL